MQIPATEKSFQHGPHPRVEGAQRIPEPFVPDAEEILEAVVDQVFELVRGRAGAVARSGGRRRGHEKSRPWPEGGNGGEAGQPEGRRIQDSGEELPKREEFP